VLYVHKVGLSRILFHRSAPVHGVWWTSRPGLGSKWIPARNPSCVEKWLARVCYQGHKFRIM